MKVLNIDNLAKKPARTVKIGEQEYEVIDMTVENFIETSKAAARVEDGTITEQIEATIGMIQRSIPTMPKEVITGLSLDALQAIVEFVREDAEADAPAAPAAPAEGATAETPSGN